MSKLIVLIMDSQYPFVEKIETRPTEEVILVRQTIKARKQDRSTVMAKANFIKNLKNKYLVKVDSIYEEDDSIHIMYEYVSTNLKTALEHATVQTFYSIQEQIKNLSLYLSNIGVKALYTLDRLGLDSKRGVKFFIGLDFSWERQPEQDFLERYYDSQAEELLNPYYPDETIQHYATEDWSKNYDDGKRRKVSFATLPSRFNRYKKIDKRLNSMKASEKERDERNLRSLSNADTVPRNVLSKNTNEMTGRQVTKRIEDRKYSGDIRADMLLRNRLEQKESDIKSQYRYKRSKAKETPRGGNDSNKSEATSKTKSRIEEMKTKEYKDIANSNKDYLKDFLSVLEEDEDISPKQASKFHSETTVGRKGMAGSDTSIFGSSNAIDLQMKAKKAISNSMKVMLKFKSFLHQG